MSVKVEISLDFLDGSHPSVTTLVQMLIDAHTKAATDNANASSIAGRMSMEGSGSFCKSVCSSMLTIGDLHAPVAMARWHLLNTGREVARVMAAGKIKIPGFGNSFFSDGIDPSFQPVYDFIKSNFSEFALRIDDICQGINDAGKKVYPNAAILTAAVCEISQCPYGLEDAIFLVGRIPAWANSAHQIINNK